MVIPKDMPKILLFTALIFNAFGFAQFGTVQIIDANADSGNAKKITTADIDNDGFQDIIVARGFGASSISYYRNLQNGNFSEKIITDVATDNPNGLAVADFNNDGWKDLVTLSQTMDEIVWIPNHNGNFENRIVIDTDVTFSHAVATADFDHNGSPDFVAIGQHFINFYRNNGNGIFSKEPILTTETSSNVLECLYLEVADMNNDGHPDLLTAETLGGVIYFNNGLGNFTPTVFTTNRFISSLIHAFDANNDGFQDAFVHDTTGKINLYLNTGNGNMVYQTTAFLAQGMQLRSLQTADMNGDGFSDIFTALNFKAVAYLNNRDNTFGSEATVHQDPDIFIREVAVADLDNDNIPEYIWAGVNHTVAYQEKSLLDRNENLVSGFTVYPNPSAEKITIEVQNKTFTATIFNLSGQKIKQETADQKFDMDVSGLSKGLYFIEIKTQNVPVETQNLKFIKN